MVILGNWIMGVGYWTVYTLKAHKTNVEFQFYAVINKKNSAFKTRRTSTTKFVPHNCAKM